MSSAFRSAASLQERIRAQQQRLAEASREAEEMRAQIEEGKERERKLIDDNHQLGGYSMALEFDLSEARSEGSKQGAAAARSRDDLAALQLSLEETSARLKIVKVDRDALAERVEQLKGNEKTAVGKLKDALVDLRAVEKDRDKAYALHRNVSSLLAKEQAKASQLAVELEGMGEQQGSLRNTLQKTREQLSVAKTQIEEAERAREQQRLSTRVALEGLHGKMKAFAGGADGEVFA